MHKIEKAIERAIKFRSHGVLINETFDVARNQAKKAIKDGKSPFPIVVKDCFLAFYYLKRTENIATTCASQMLENFIPPVSSTVVDRIVHHGGCIIGKANLDEFCMGTSSALGHFGPVKSDLGTTTEKDWNVPGGSSGGSAVAVQVGIADIALGSDTGGSTRNPAAFNGIFGFKPTYGVLSRSGLIPLVNSLDAPSVLANSAEDCWKAIEYAKGIDCNDSTSIDLPIQSKIESLSGLVIGVPLEYHNECLSTDAWKLWNKALNIFKRNGCEIVQISLPNTKYSLACYSVISAVDIVSNMARYDSVAYGYRNQSANSSTYEMYATSRSEALNNVVKRRIFAGNYFLMKENRNKYYQKALKVRRLITNEIVSQFSNNIDIIVTPTSSGSAPRYSELSGTLFSKEDDDDYFTQAANLAGIPSISVPIGIDSKKLPIGVQLMGNRLSDRLLCDVAAILHSKVNN